MVQGRESQAPRYRLTAPGCRRLLHQKLRPSSFLLAPWCFSRERTLSSFAYRETAPIRLDLRNPPRSTPLRLAQPASAIYKYRIPQCSCLPFVYCSFIFAIEFSSLVLPRSRCLRSCLQPRRLSPRSLSFPLRNAP